MTYGPSRFRLPRLFLHCAALRLIDASGAPAAAKAPLPAELETVLARLREAKEKERRLVLGWLGGWVSGWVGT